MKDLLELTEERTEGRTGAQTAATTSGGQYYITGDPLSGANLGQGGREHCCARKNSWSNHEGSFYARQEG
ncbi:hypothetical protein N9Q44_01560 [Gammaproteobacteria bacterium]|nr:hypothetical protein [Gammaproteobacteria bacterium]